MSTVLAGVSCLLLCIFFLRADEESEHRSLANDMKSRHTIAYLSIEKVRRNNYTAFDVKICMRGIS